MKTLLERADDAREKSQFLEARGLYLRASRKKIWRAEALIGAADCGRLLGKFPEAASDYERAIRTLGPPGFSSRVADAKTGLALSLRGMGQPAKALRLLKQTEAYYRRSKDPQGLAFIAWALGGTFRIAGQMRPAKLYLSMALQRYKKLKDFEGQAYVSCALGGVARMLGDYSSSRRYYRAAHATLKRFKDSFGIAYSYCGLGNSYRMQGDYSLALSFFKKAEKAYARIGDRVSYAYTIWSMATAFKMLGQDAKARQAFLRCAKFFRQTRDPRGLAYAEMGLAELALQKGGLKTAVMLISQAKKHALAFKWESLHVKWLSGAGSHSDYKKAGSRFVPSKVPINWP